MQLICPLCCVQGGPKKKEHVSESESNAPADRSNNVANGRDLGKCF